MVWIILAVILLLILILMFSPVRIFFDYRNGKCKVVLKYLFFKRILNEKKKKTVKSQNNGSDEKKEDKSSTGRLKKLIPDDTEGKIGFVMNLLNSGGKAVRHFTRRICIKDIYIDFVISDLDAYECALKFGKTNIAVYNILAYLGCFLKLKKKSISIKCVYNQPESVYNMSFTVKCPPAAGISVLIVFIFTFLVNNKNIRKQKQCEPQS